MRKKNKAIYITIGLILVVSSLAYFVVLVKAKTQFYVGDIEKALYTDYKTKFVRSNGAVISNYKPVAWCPNAGIGCDNDTTSESVARLARYSVLSSNKADLDLEIDLYYDYMKHPATDYMMWKLNPDLTPVLNNDNMAVSAVDAELIMIEALLDASKSWDTDSKGRKYTDTARLLMDSLKDGVFDGKYLPFCMYPDGDKSMPCEKRVFLGYLNLQTLNRMCEMDNFWCGVYTESKQIMIGALNGKGAYTVYTPTAYQYSDYLKSNNGYQYENAPIHANWVLRNLVTDSKINTNDQCGSSNCGDNICNNVENCNNCPSDCGTCNIPSPSMIYYVDGTNGNDANDGLSTAKAFKTVKKGLTVLKAGYTLQIRGGVYKEKLSMSGVSGTSTGYITIMPYNGETVIFDGVGAGTADKMFLMDSCKYIKIIGLEFRNHFMANLEGIVVRGKSAYIEIRNNKIHDIKVNIPTSGNGHAVFILGNDATYTLNNIIIDGNEIYNIEPGWSEALTVEGNVQYFTISNNIIRDIGNIGIDLAGHFGECPDPALDQARNGVISDNVIYNCFSPNGGGHAAGLYTDGGKDLVMERNIVHDTNRGIEIGCENPGKTASGIIVRNNIVYNNEKTGIGIGGYSPTQAGKVINSQIYNNIFYKNDYSNYGGGELMLGVLDNVEIKNNIFYGIRSTLVTGQGVSTSYMKNIAADNNIWYSDSGLSSARFLGYTLSSYQSTLGWEKNSRFIQPLFIDAAAKNFRSATGSPAIDTGVNVGVTGDFDKTSRPQGIGYDIGAFEKSDNSDCDPSTSFCISSENACNSSITSWESAKPYYDQARNLFMNNYPKICQEFRPDTGCVQTTASIWVYTEYLEMAVARQDKEYAQKLIDFIYTDRLKTIDMPDQFANIVTLESLGYARRAFGTIDLPQYMSAQIVIPRLKQTHFTCTPQYCMYIN